MRTSEARRHLTRTGNAWPPIRGLSINPAVNTARVISSFAAQTSLVCAAAKRFDNSAKRQHKAMTKKQNERGSSTFARSVRVLKSRTGNHETPYLDQATRLLGIYVLPREGPVVAARPRVDRILGEVLTLKPGFPIRSLACSTTPATSRNQPASQDDR